MTSDADLLQVSGLSVAANTVQGRIELLRDVDLRVAAGDRVGLIGESGSGKTTLARAIIGLLDANLEVSAGTVELDGRRIVAPGEPYAPGVRGAEIGMVFQSALASLNPFRRLRSQLREILKVHRPELDRAAADEEMERLVERMGVKDIERVLGSYPHQVSGGQRQRVSIAVALAPSPRMLIADECTSALDVSAQAQTIDLLRDVTGEDRGLLFVTHDLMLAGELCNRVVVMYRGVVVESGPTEAVLHDPQHPYTQRLLAAIPEWRPRTGSWPPPLAAVGEPVR